MQLKLQHLLKSFEDKEFPPYPCPKCNATLRPLTKTLHIYESAESSRLHDLGAIGPDEGGGVFIVIMQCSNSNCSEHVAVAGDQNPTLSEDSHGEEYIASLLTPTYFAPPLSLFDVSENVPDDIKRSLASSFSLFWDDPSASGNAIRIAVEQLMDHQKVKKLTKRPGKKNVRIPLHDRILNFSKSNQKLGDLLLAIKWIGNAGSHEQTLKKENLIEAYTMLEHVLQEIFEKRSAILAKTARRINKRKKP